MSVRRIPGGQPNSIKTCVVYSFVSAADVMFSQSSVYGECCGKINNQLTPVIFRQISRLLTVHVRTERNIEHPWTFLFTQMKE
jgi:hypothetical protein